MACNGLFGNGSDGSINPPDPNRTFTIQKCQIAIFDAKAYKLYLDFKIIVEMADKLPEDSNRGSQAMQCAANITNIWSAEDPESWARSQEIASKFLSQTNGSSQHTVIATGHCHIDVAWLWPYAETRRKAARSWASQCEYMDHHPNFVFSQSQVQLYDWVKQDYPELFEKIKQKVAKGQFIPVGGTWVEMDGILPSGESMVRQFLYGQRFFKKEFGLLATEFWLPDSFGYSSQLPQIMKGAKISAFVTQKLSWNMFNKFPYQTFLWEGLDGSEILTHFPPADSYVSRMTVDELLFMVKNHKTKEKSNYALALYGYGDGGGGPTEEMLHRIETCQDVDALPRVIYGTPKQFFDLCRNEQGEFNRWRGELYLEMHRGTYTSQASTKKGNRKGEVMLHDVEVLAVLSGSISRGEYPTGELERLWKLLLLNQFHDVLPGSSIHMVYEDALKYYEEIMKYGTKLKTISILRMLSESEEKNAVTVINTLGWHRKEVCELPDEIESVQKSYNRKPLAIVEAPAIGLKKNTISQAKDMDELSIDEDKETITMKNKFVLITISKGTGAVSVYDRRAERFAVKDGNIFCMYEDIPLFWDAWDLEFYYENKKPQIGKVSSISISEKGPLRVSTSIEITLTDSCKLRQHVCLTPISPRLDFHCHAVWENISHKLLKVLFPTTIRCSEATYEVQFGHIKRPTHRNTTWDQARFEVHGHKFADLSEYGYGVSLLNDCKYGYSTKNNVMTLSLLRAPKMPDDRCDMGEHEFSYALLPHLGTFQECAVVQEAHNFNTPLIISSRLPKGDVQELSLFKSSHSGIVVDTVKKAEDDDSVIVRLYEAFGGYQANVTLETQLPLKSVKRCNLLEEEEKDVSFNDNKISIGGVNPFQIVTLKLKY